MAGAVAQGAGVVVGARITGNAGVELELEAIGLAIRCEEEIAAQIRGKPGNRLSSGGGGGVAPCWEGVQAHRSSKSTCY